MEARLHRPKENVKALSEEERLRRVAAMQQDAETFDSSRAQRHQAYVEGEKARGGDDGHTGQAAFIDSMRKDVYSLSGAAGGGIQERLQQNKHYQQSSNDMDRDGYRKN